VLALVPDANAHNGIVNGVNVGVNPAIAPILALYPLPTTTAERRSRHHQRKWAPGGQ